MLSSLRFKLWAAFALVIFLSLFLAGSAFVVLVRNYHARLAMERLADLAGPITLQVSMLEHAGASSATISAFLQEQGEEVGVRILLVDANGRVVEDTKGVLKGRQVDLQRASTLVSKWNRTMLSGALRTPDRNDLYYVAASAPSVRPLLGESFFSRTPSYVVVLAVPQQSVGSAWVAVAPSLSIAAILSLVVSVGVAVFLARSIARPIVEVTRASEAMARGRYDHHVAVKGQDEVARLARSFNVMAQQVGRTHRTLREFLANASHELKTPLTSIQGFSQAMVDGAITEPEAYARAGEIINAEAERMRNLVDDLLLLSRMESGEVAMECEPIDVADLLVACIERFRWRAEKQGVELATNWEPDLGRVVGDSRRLEQVFGNLLDNALRYTPQGGTVTVSAEVAPSGSAKAVSATREAVQERSAGQPWVHIRVRNTGSWIPAEDLPRVFERFYRSRANPDRGGDGTGLGLAIVREIVQAHGGSVVARSEPEMGTEFEVDLPAEVGT